jgi:hypothetical protein
VGATYYVVSVSMADQYPWAADSLRRYNMGPPSPSEVGRNPTPRELRTVLDELSGYTVDYLVGPGNWQADVDAKTGLRPFRSTTLVSVIDFQGEETTPHLFCFEKGDLTLNILIVERLSRLCGPLFVVPDTGARPLLVTPGIDPKDAVKVWEIV